MSLQPASQFRIISVLGAPGVGKGTQSALISQHFGFFHVSVGDVLRREQKKENSEDGRIIKECLQKNKLAPADITCKLLRKELERLCNENNGQQNFLIDGFPRNTANMREWEVSVTLKLKIFKSAYLYSTCTCIGLCILQNKKLHLPLHDSRRAVLHVDVWLKICV